MTAEYIVGIDIGGTFTDCVVVDESGVLTIGKALSTPDDFSLGAIAAARDAAQRLGLRDETDLMQATRLFFHACTVGDNTLITRAGAKTGLLATKGFGDAMLMMRGKITQGLDESEAAHLAAIDKPEPIVPRWLIGEVTERVDYKGAPLIPLGLEEAEGVIARLVAEGVESLAICLLWSIANNAHERALAELCRQRFPQLFLSLSSDVAPFLGEYERTATTVFNAYIGPKISVYLRHLRDVLAAKGLRREPLIMQAYGGVLGIDACCQTAMGTIESGPAAGVTGSRFVGDMVGAKNILATDMGGTTFKVSIIRDGVIERDYKPVFMRHSILTSKIWVESIGAGGGSIAWIEPESGLLQVGPEGAGSKPGPVCYGLGGVEPTVSDADIVLGYLNPDYFLGGKMKLDKAGALRAMDEKIARPLRMSVIEAAAGIYRIANSHMSDLIRRATVERGHDPRRFVLFAYGGAGPMHAGRYARDLGIGEVVIPLTASVHGAAGLISSDVVYEYGRSDHLRFPADLARINQNFHWLMDQAARDLKNAGFDGRDVVIQRSVDMRYGYQVHELNVPIPEGSDELTTKDIEELCARFDELYERAYGQGSAYREAGREIISFRVSATGRLARPQIQKHTLSTNGKRDGLRGKREVYFQERGDFVDAEIYDFERMHAGAEVVGPAIIETPVTTIVVNPNDVARVDEYRNIRIQLGAG
jgi:N-methylhydantoinase A